MSDRDEALFPQDFEPGAEVPGDAAMDEGFDEGLDEGVFEGEEGEVEEYGDLGPLPSFGDDEDGPVSLARGAFDFPDDPFTDEPGPASAKPSAERPASAPARPSAPSLLSIHDEEPVQALLDLDEVRVDASWSRKLPERVVRRRRVLPIGLSAAGEVHVAVEDARERDLEQLLPRWLGHPVVLEAATRDSLERAIVRCLGEERRPTPSKTPAEPAGDPVQTGSELLDLANAMGASDLHLNPQREGLRVEMRIDGELQLYRVLPSVHTEDLVRRFKVMSGLDISEVQSPQDGRLRHESETTHRLDVRVATLPTRYGERVSLRLLRDDRLQTLRELGLDDPQRDVIQDALATGSGLVVLVGPTGSGKTTTVYACLRHLMEERSCSVITLEDPVEQELPGVSQVEVVEPALSFAAGLRSALRHHPDVLMVGEIRDAASADISIKAASSGHLVLTTLHAHDSMAAVARFQELGVDPARIANSLRLVISQRLVPRLCPHCREPQEMSPQEAAWFGAEGLTYACEGCLYCGGLGRLGRLGVFELLEWNADWARLIRAGADTTALRSRWHSEGLLGLSDAARRTVDRGLVRAKDAMSSVREAPGSERRA